MLDGCVLCIQFQVSQTSSIYLISTQEKQSKKQNLTVLKQ